MLLGKTGDQSVGKMQRGKSAHRKDRRLTRPRTRHRFSFEPLESRRMLVGEGEVYSLSQTLDSISLAGSYTASVNWGDGSSSVATVSPGQLTSKLTARIDYSLDTSGFFSSSARRQLLQASVDSIVARFSDTLAAIQPTGSNSWVASFDHPSQAGVTATRNNLSIAENEIVIFAGARPMSSPQLGQGGFGDYQASGASTFLNAVQTRGQGTTTGTNANDFGPWGGSISFNTNTNWYFGADPAGISSGQQDFVTVATHELIHLLGFGVSPSWQRLVSGQSFTGSNARGQYDGSGNVPLSADRGHWQVDLQDGGAETLMDPNQLAGTRKVPTALDMAALRDVGWNVASSSVLVTATHTFADDDQFPVSITVTGSRLGKVQRSLNVNITNSPPSLTVPATQTAVVGQTLSLSNVGQISDPGFRNSQAIPPTEETFTYTINWGDNSPESSGTATIDQLGNATRPTLASFDGSHTFMSPGTFVVRVTAVDDDGGSTSRSFPVNVQPAPMLAIESNRTSIVEDGSVSATLTLTRSGGDTTQPLTVNLVSSDISEATVPASIIFAAGVTSTNIQLQPIDDNLLDGSQVITITASATGIESASVEVTVEDAEFLLAEALQESVIENAGADAIGFRVSRSNTNVQTPLTVAIAGSNPALAEPITSIVIPAGQQHVDFRLDAVDDEIAELTKILTLSFAASGYASASGSVSILDNEPPKYQNPVNPLDVNGDGNIFPIDALIIINFINRQSATLPLDPEAGLDLLFIDVTGDYLALPLDALQIINAINRGNVGESEGEESPAAQRSLNYAPTPAIGISATNWANSIDDLFSDEDEDQFQPTGMRLSSGT